MIVSESKPGGRAKKGRRGAHYTTSWDEPISGLARRPSDGRWRIIGTSITFTEPDERMAIHRFKRWKRDQDNARHLKQVPIARVPARESLKPALEQATAKREIIIAPEVTITKQGNVVAHFDITRAEDERELWAWFREQLLTNAKHAAEMTGMVELEYLSELNRPTESPLLDDVGTTYFEKTSASKHEVAKSRTFWREFVEIVGVDSLRELKTHHVSNYFDEIMSRGMSPTYVAHRFGKVKSIIAFAKKRGMNASDCAKALDACAVLVPPAKEAANPQPIARETFRTLYQHADDKMKAVLLVALNCAMYGAEVVDLAWGDIQLGTKTLVTTRGKSIRQGKKTITRAAVLWDRTVEALAKLKPGNATATTPVFGSFNANIVNKAFYDLRTAAGVPMAIKFNMIRDGAYTAAVEDSRVQFEHAQVLAGHRCGIADKYISRRPQMVALACEAIEKAYFG